MIADDSDAVTVTFLRLMRAELRAERVGEDSLGRTVDLARRWWGGGDAAEARLADALRELHGEPVDTDDPRQVADAATALAADSGLLTPPDPRGAAVARFAANARRLRTGEITPAEFDEIMATDDPDRPDA
ncbi:hypothetical protein ACFFMM_21965 [Micromonospora chaiyaphumensis]|uniref:Uncharacterized protein n=1 Tax=Micromonospora chaiyaphumensis TaxID=307119 RepID=A0A1C4U2W5_9ACTN|nr:hypothetical protein [Micromonospora chaiyaphumensis]SCE65984.1 hypothetical protein GA0070214_101295 [Micromonospora chaiyaphumensis]